MTKFPSLSELALSVKPGLYEHHKGMPYRVLGVARHSENGDECVIYQALYGDFGLWMRPVTMFCETVVKDGITVPRFRFVKNVD